MNMKTCRTALTLLLFTATPALAQTNEPESSTEPMDTVTLETMEVIGESQELALRVMKIGFENTRSSRNEDANEIVCKIRSKTGSHLNYVYCGKNWALDSLARYYQAPLNHTASALLPRTRENLYRSSQFISPGFLESVLDQLGPSALNREIVQRKMNGQPLPDYVPTEEALGRFLEAYTQVEGIRAHYDPRLTALSGADRRALQADVDAKMIAAIEEASLTLETYNKISAMSEEYASLHNYLAKRVASN